MIGAVLLVVSALDFSTAVGEMERAVILGDEATLERIAGDFRDALDDEDTAHDPRLRYAYAFVNWRLTAFHDRESEPSKKLLKIAEEHLKEIVEENPGNAEAQALYGTVNGWLITSMWSGMRRGPRSNKAYDRAREAEPDNPRVAMHEGVSRLFRPGAFGGGVGKAEAE